jgi:PGF-CTERM protein
VSIRLASDNPDNPFLSQPEGEIQPDGTFETGEKDFTDLQPGSNLTLSVTQDGFSDEWDGVVLESTAANETETDTSSNATETEMPDTETEMPDTETEMMEDTETAMPDTEETTTGGSGPGFTVVAALGALIAAALLAVRRNN